jgi:hypothetical protein
MGLLCKKLPCKLIDGRCRSRSQMDELQAIPFKTDLLNQPLRIDKALLRTHVSFPVAARTLGAGNHVYLIGAGLQCTHEVQGLDAPAARQGEKPDSRAELLFEGTPVNILVGIDSLAEKYRDLQSRALLIHECLSL